MVFVLFIAFICSDSIINSLKRVTNGSFLFLCKMFAFLFLLFLNLGAQIRCLQNWYIYLKLASDQPLIEMKWEEIFISFWGHSNIKTQKNKEHNLENLLVSPPYHLCRKSKLLKKYWEEIQSLEWFKKLLVWEYCKEI